MPTLYKAQLVESETPWVEIWKRFHADLLPFSRRLLHMMGFFEERDLAIPLADVPLSKEEELEFETLITPLTKAAVEAQWMPPGVMISTLLRIANNPPEQIDQLPGIIQWVLAAFYRRGDEVPGTFALDIWGTEQVKPNYIFGRPTPENTARAAQAAMEDLVRSPGRRPNAANFVLAEELAPIFRRSGKLTTRQRRDKRVYRENGDWVIEYIESGPYYDFVRLVVDPLNRFLSERSLPPVTVESIVGLSSS